MKKLILLELLLLFLSTTFQSDNPPGWYQQTLPVNDHINDIFFLDSLNGWVVTQGNSGDTSYIMKTSNGGNNWTIQQSGLNDLYAIQMVDENIGYTVGTGSGISRVFKTMNSGLNWIQLNVLNQVGIINDLNFVNKDTGWVCSNDFLDGGVFKTTDGGNSFQTQLGASYHPIKIFFINKDTGWFININDNSYKTTNGGENWLLQTSFGSDLFDIFFLNNNTGFVSSTRIYKTTNGGVNWSQSQSKESGFNLSFASDSIGWAGVNFFKIAKTLDAGETWFYQNSPIFNNVSVNAIDSLKAWAGGSGLVQTTDGGGITSAHQFIHQLPKSFILDQNYPNPFNPKTVISYQLIVRRLINLKVYDVLGNEVKTLVNQKQNAGEYRVEFDGSGLNSGVYFYKLVVDSFGEVFDEKKNQVFSETKKMLLVK